MLLPTPAPWQDVGASGSGRFSLPLADVCLSLGCGIQGCFLTQGAKAWPCGITAPATSVDISEVNQLCCNILWFSWSCSKDNICFYPHSWLLVLPSENPLGRRTNLHVNAKITRTKPHQVLLNKSNVVSSAYNPRESLLQTWICVLLIPLWVNKNTFQK